MIGDTGPGIADDIGDRMFEPFLTTKPGGLGTRLMLSRALITSHCGRLEIVRISAEGITFAITLRSLAAAEKP